MVPKRILGLVSTKDPLEADDFDDEAFRDAAEYNLLRQFKAETDKGAKAKLKAKLAQGRGSRSSLSPTKKRYWEDPSEDESSGSEDGGERRKRKWPGSDRDLRYEGQVILDYNPLERMAGLEVKARAPKGNDQDIWSPVKDEDGPSDAKRTANHQSSTVVVKPENDEPEQEYDYDYEDEEVIIPTGARLVFDKPAQAREQDESIEEQEEVYSDDEIFAESTATLVPPQPRPHASLASIREIRPNFKLEYDPANDVSLILDPVEPDIRVPPSINRYLKAYQRDGAKFLFSKYREGMGGVLGDDMGLGKTIQVISFLSAIMRKTGTSEDDRRRKNLIRRMGEDIAPKRWPTAMIICPKFLIKNWQRELDTWGYFETATWQTESWKDTKNSFLRGYLDIILISYETARQHIEAIKEMPISVVIADEAHRLKEPRAAISLALKKIQGAACFALTGTLIQNRIDEMWSVLDFVQRGHAGTIRQWRDFAVNPIKLGHRREGTAEEVVNGIIRLGMMVHKILPRFYLRRDKRLIAHELPIKRDLIVFCPLGNSQVQAYQALIASDDVQFILRRNDPCECGSDNPRRHCCHARTAAGEELRDVILKYINALMKVANHLALLYQAKDDAAQVRDVNRKLFKICMGEEYNPRIHSAIRAALDPDNCGKWPLLANLLQQWRKEDTDNKVLIFSNSVRLLKMIAEFITTSLSYSFDILTGEVGTDERMDMVDKFQDPDGDMYILLISTMAGGVGLNLTAANKVVIFDPAWNPANDLQAMDRAFRIGQKRTVDVYRLIGQGTLEELMYERQVHKQQRARQINDGTFERRIHQGYEGARHKEEQGELFGTHNIFKFDPKGFMKGNLERVRLAEDQFMQDMVETRYEDEDGSEDEDDDAGAKMRNERKSRDLRKASDLARAREQQDAKSVLANVLGEEAAEATTQRNDILKQLGVNSHVHEEAFRDSPQERQIYELGLQLLKANPELARKTKANELGRIGKAVLKPDRGERGGAKQPKQEVVDEEPWNSRFANVKRRKAEAKAVLAELSD